MKIYIKCLVTRHDGTTFIQLLTVWQANKISELLHSHLSVLAEHVEVPKETYYHLFPGEITRDGNKNSYYNGKFYK